MDKNLKILILVLILVFLGIFIFFYHLLSSQSSSPPSPLPAGAGLIEQRKAELLKMSQSLTIQKDTPQLRKRLLEMSESLNK